jgi:hypothetical protein
MDDILVSVGLTMSFVIGNGRDLWHCGGESQNSCLLWAEVQLKIPLVAILNVHEDITGYRFGWISSEHGGFETRKAVSSKLTLGPERSELDRHWCVRFHCSSCHGASIYVCFSWSAYSDTAVLRLDGVV